MAPRKRKTTSTGVAGSVAALIADNRSLTARNAELEAEIASINAALGGSTRQTGRRGRQALAEPVKKTRRPITDPAVLERKREALSKARAARAAKREAANPSNGSSTAPVPEAASKPKRSRKPKTTPSDVTQSEPAAETQTA
jgi:hypothetical protein